MSDATTTLPALGFIGLGAMGSRMARRLLEAGYRLGVFDRSKDKARPLAEQGARVYESLRALARDAEVLMSSLADDAAVEQVLLGSEGAVDEMRAGTTLIDLSSVYPDTSRAVAAEAQSRGVAMLDAPVSGSTPQAADGRLIMFVGGDRNTYERCRPILNVIGQATFYLGPSDFGNILRLAQACAVPMPVTAAAQQVYAAEQARGIEEDFSAVIRATAELAGLPAAAVGPSN